MTASSDDVVSGEHTKAEGGKSSSHKLIAQSEDIAGDGNFPQGCAFAPDGLCVLTCTANDHLLRLYNTPTPDLLGKGSTAKEVPPETACKEDWIDTQSDTRKTPEETVHPWRCALSARGGDSVRSYAWYPTMNSADPSTCCFLSTSRDQPIHLVDAYTSAIRASYRPYNALDEMESPSVVTFTPDGQRIFASGFTSDRTVHVFETGTPGRDSTVLRLGKTRRSSDGQKGLVSAISFSSHHHGHNHVFAVGTYAPGSIYLYDDRMPTSVQPAGTIMNGVCVVGHGSRHSRKKRRFASIVRDGNDNKEEDDFSFSAAKVQWFQNRARGGVTQLSFSPGQPYILYSASRRADSILSWDVRMVSGSSDFKSCPIRGFKAFATDNDTNQRLEFDFDKTGQRLFAGGRDGCLRIYNVESGEMTGMINTGMSDAVNGVSYSYNAHHNCGHLALAVGSRRFVLDDDDEISGYANNGDVVPGSIELYRI